MLKLIVNELLEIRGVNHAYNFLRKHGFSNYKISLLQTGNAKSFQIKDIEYLCEILKCTPNDLFDWKEDGNNQLPESHPLRTLVKKPGINLSKITTDMSTKEFEEFSKRVLEIKNEIKAGD